MTTVYLFKAAFTKLGSAYAPSPAPTCTVVDTSNNVLVNAQPVTTLSNMIGVCLYSYSGADGLDLIGKFSTTDILVDAADLFSYTPSILTTKLDAKISDVLAYELISLAKESDALAIKAKTDQLVFTVANQVDANALTGGGGGGSGSTSKTVTITDGTNPLDGVNVWVTTDLVGTNIIAQGYTDILGNVTFMLDAGAYYFWKQLAGYNFINPQTDAVP